MYDKVIAPNVSLAPPLQRCRDATKSVNKEYTMDISTTLDEGMKHQKENVDKKLISYFVSSPEEEGSNTSLADSYSPREFNMLIRFWNASYSEIEANLVFKYHYSMTIIFAACGLMTTMGPAGNRTGVTGPGFCHFEWDTSKHLLTSLHP